MIGKGIDERYQIDRVLAMGGMGTVYLGRHLKLKKRVALKVLHPDAEDHPELFLRFEREALAGAQVNHPNVAAATDFGELPDGTRYLVMEYVRGGTLRSVLDASAPLPPVRAVLIARQIAVALAEIHKRGIVHRDLKPRNVMLGEGDTVKIVDFGLAKIDGARMSTMPKDEEDEGRLTATGTIFGTIEYLAPEAALGMEVVDLRADLYALGVVLYEMLTGKHPFDAVDDVELFDQQRHKQVPTFAERAPGITVPSAIEGIVRKLLEKDMTKRYQTALDLVAALDAALPEARNPSEPAPASAVTSSKPARSARAVLLSVEESDDPPSNDSAAASPTSLRSVEQSGPAPVSEPSSRNAFDEAPEPAPEKAKGQAHVWTPKPPASRPNAAIYVAGVVVALAVALYAATRSDTDDDRSDTTVDPLADTRAPAPTIATTATAAASAAVTSTETTAPLEPTEVASMTASASAAIVPVDPKDVDAIAGKVDDGDLDGAAALGHKLLSAHPTLVQDKLGASAIRKLVVALAQQGHARTQEIYRAVGTTQGTQGPDLLYKLLESNGRSVWGTEARRTLADPAVIEMTSAPLRIAYALRVAPCNEKLELLDRAASEGDGRAIVVLDIQARGCFNDSRRVDAALERLKKRLATPAR